MPAKLSDPFNQTTVPTEPLSVSEARKKALGRAAHEANAPFPNYTLPEYTPTPTKMSAMEAARFAGVSPQSKEAEDIARLADPRNAANLQHDVETAAHVKGIARKGLNPYLKRLEQQIAIPEEELATRYQSKTLEPALRAARRAHDESLGEQKANISSRGLYNKPGLRYSGHKDRSLQRLENQAATRWEDLVARLSYQSEQDSMEKAFKQKGLWGNLYQSIGATRSADLSNQLLGAQALNSMEDNRLNKYQKYAGVTQGFGAKKEAREQALKDALYSQFQEAESWPRFLTKYFTDISKEVPTAPHVHHTIQQNTAPIYTGFNQQLGNVLGNMGSRMAQSHAHGDLVTSEAMFNSMVDNTDPLATLNKMVRHQLMIGLMKRSSNQRKKFKKGGAVSPIAAGAAEAKNVAATHRDNTYNDIMNRQLAEAERMRQPQEAPSFMNQLIRAIGEGSAVTEGHKDFGKAILAPFAETEARQTAHKAQRDKSFDLEKEVAKELNEQRKFDHHAAMDERRVKADERRAAIEERRFSREGQHKPHIIEGHQIIVDKDGKVHAIPIEGFSGKVDNKREDELDEKISALKEAYQDYVDMDYLANDIHTGAAGYIPSVLTDMLPSALGGTEGKQGQYEKAAESAIQNRARAKFGKSRIPVAEVESARRTIPSSKMNLNAIKRVIPAQQEAMKDQLRTLLAQKKREYPGDLSIFNDSSSRINPTTTLSSLPTTDLQKEREALMRKAVGRGGD